MKEYTSFHCLYVISSSFCCIQDQTYRDSHTMKAQFVLLLFVVVPMISIFLRRKHPEGKSTFSFIK